MANAWFETVAEAQRRAQRVQEAQGQQGEQSEENRHRVGEGWAKQARQISVGWG